MNFLKGVVYSFIPNEQNGYKPYFFRARSMIAMAAIILFLGVSGLALQTLIVIKNNSIAAVISSVLVNLANGDRTQNGLNNLAINPTLQKAAQLKANDMATKSYFAHTSPDGITPWYWFKQVGYGFSYAGENLAVRFSDSVSLENAWMNSPTHRANILNEQFTEIGIATAEGVYQGQSVVFVVQEFGRPASIQTATVIQPQITATTTVAATAASTKPLVAGTSTPPKKTSAKTLITPVAKTTLAQVAGTSTEDTPKVIIENDSFIAVRAVSATSTLVAIAPTGTFVAFIQKLATSPRTLVSWVYLLIAAVIGVAIALMVGIKLKRQHPLNVLYSVLLLILMAGLVYLGQLYFPGQLAIL